jgi:hypothetical protein
MIAENVILVDPILLPKILVEYIVAVDGTVIPSKYNTALPEVV